MKIWQLLTLLFASLIHSSVSNKLPYETADFPPQNLSLLRADDFSLTRRLGTGKFSNVFEAFHGKKLKVLKVLKPVSDRKIRREVWILQKVRSLKHVVQLEGLVWQKPHPALVLEHAGVNAKWLCHSAGEMTDWEVRYYLGLLLVALESLHAEGIMHRDVKPRNVLRNSQSLLLIDLGLADVIEPDKRYNVRVASRHYKGPELLVGYEYYNHKLDLWGVGCILGSLLLRKEPLFCGKDNDDQLRQIVEELGSQDLRVYVNKYGMEVTDEVKELLERETNRRDWSASCDAVGLDLLNHLLVYDHEERLNATQALEHEFFDQVRDLVRSR